MIPENRVKTTQTLKTAVYVSKMRREYPSEDTDRVDDGNQIHGQVKGHASRLGLNNDEVERQESPG